MTLQSIFTVHNVTMGIAALITLFVLAKLMKAVVYAVYGCALSIAVYISCSPLLIRYIPQLHNIPYGETFVSAFVCIIVSLCFCHLINEIPFAPLRFVAGLLLFLVFAAPSLLSFAISV